MARNQASHPQPVWLLTSSSRRRLNRNLSTRSREPEVGMYAPRFSARYLRMRVGTEASGIQQMPGPIRSARPLVSALELHADKVAYLSKDAVSNNCGNVSPTGFEGYCRTGRKRPLRLNACS